MLIDRVLQIAVGRGSGTEAAVGALRGESSRC